MIIVLDEQKNTVAGPVAEREIDAALTDSDECIVVIPGTLVTQFTTELPIKRKDKLRQALPFAIEENIAGKLDDIHIAIMQAEESEQIVQCLSKTWLHEALEKLAAENIIPDKVISELSLISANEKCWEIYYRDDISLLAADNGKVFACDSENLAYFLKECLAAASKESKLPQQINITAFTQKLINIKPNQHIDVTISRKREKDWLPFLTKKIAKYSGANLLQAEFQTSSRGGEAARYWRFAAGFAVFFVLLFLGSAIIEYGVLSYQQRQLSAQTITLYREIFPKAQRVANVQINFKKLLRRLRQEHSGDEFLTFVSYLGPVLQAMPDIELKGLQFQQEILTVKIETNSLARLDKFDKRLVRQLQSHGLKVKQTKAQSRGAIVQAEFELSE